MIIPPFQEGEFYTNNLATLAFAAARRWSLDPPLVCAVCEEESGLRDTPGIETWNPYAIRFEAGFERKYIHPAIPDMPTTRELCLAMSFGLMQIMGETALELGFNGHFFTELCYPQNGLEFGCKKLARCFEHVSGDQANRRALLCYNGGGDAQYPDRVLARVGKYQPLRA